MSDRTGIARGSLSPAIYFERSDGYVILAPGEKGNREFARMAYDLKYSREGWQWREAGTLHDVDRLQQKLADQEMRRMEQMACVNQQVREEVMRQTGAALRNVMVSAGTSDFEKEFIRLYLDMRNEKRDKYRQELMNHNYFIAARELDSSTKIEDLMPMEAGQVERSGV